MSQSYLHTSSFVYFQSILPWLDDFALALDDVAAKIDLPSSPNLPKGLTAGGYRDIYSVAGSLRVFSGMAYLQACAH